MVKQVEDFIKVMQKENCTFFIAFEQDGEQILGSSGTYENLADMLNIVTQNNKDISALMAEVGLARTSELVADKINAHPEDVTNKLMELLNNIYDKKVQI